MGNWFWIFFPLTNRNQSFSIFEHVLLRLSDVINIKFEVGKLYFAKLVTDSF